MQRTITPFLVTGVVLIGAVAAATNPVIAPPADVRVSISDMATSGQPIDILDPVFLESIGAMRENWPTAVATLDALLADLAENPTSVSPQVLADALQRVAEMPPATDGTTRDDAHDAVRLNAPEFLTDPTESTVVVMRALANLSSGINEAANTLVQQVSMTPALILALTEQVISGEITPAEAIRRLINAPFGGQAVITGDERIDAVFQSSILQPILDALAVNPAVETGAPRTGVTPGTTSDRPAATTQAQGPVGRDNTPAEAAPPRETATAAAPQRPVIQPGGGAGPEEEDPSETPGTGAGSPNPNAPAFSSDLTDGILDRIKQAFDDFNDTVKRLTGTDDSGEGGSGSTPNTPPSGGDSGGSKDDGDDAPPSSGVGR